MTRVLNLSTTDLDSLLQLRSGLVEGNLGVERGFSEEDLPGIEGLLARGGSDVLLPPGLLSDAALRFLSATPSQFRGDPSLAADARARQIQSARDGGGSYLAQRALVDAFVDQSAQLAQESPAYANALPLQAGTQPNAFNTNDLQALVGLVMLMAQQANARKTGNGDLGPRSAFGWLGHPGGSNMDRGRIAEEYGKLGPGGNVGDVSVDRLFKAIVGQESGGKNVVNSIGATGIGQVMPANIGPWSKEALGQSISYQEFKSRPDLQAKIIQFKLKQYVQEAQSKGYSGREAIRYAAAKWYSGKGNLKDSQRPQNGGPSIAHYADSVARRYA